MGAWPYALAWSLPVLLSLLLSWHKVRHVSLPRALLCTALKAMELADLIIISGIVKSYNSKWKPGKL